MKETKEKQVAENKMQYCKLCGGKVNEDKKCTKCGKQYFRIKKDYFLYFIIIVLSIGIIITTSLYANEVQKDKQEKNSSEYKTLQAEYKELEQQVNEITQGESAILAKNKLDFFNEKIVFVIEGEGPYFYTYDSAKQCFNEMEVIQYDDYIKGKDHPLVNGKYSYKVYTREEALRIGYTNGTC